MTIITSDGRTIELMGGGDAVIDRRVSDRRVFDHIVPDQRVGDRRAPAEKPVKEEWQSAEKHWRDNLEGRNIQLWMEDMLTRFELQVGIDHTIVHQDGREEEIECFPPTL